MVADPATFRVLPWANNTGWVLCDIYFPNGKPVPFSTRALYRDALGKLGRSGFDFFAGLEVEFQLFKLIDPKLSPDGLTWPAEAPAVEHTTHGFQYLTESRFDQVDPILEVLRKTVQALGMPLLVARGRARPEPVRVHVRAGTGPRCRRHHGAVPQRHEAGGAAPRLSGELHVPAEIAEHVRQRLASAPIVAGSEIGKEPVRLRRQERIAVAARPALSRRPARRMRARRRRSPRRPSTATSAITASTRWRRSRRSGRATTAA